MPKGGFFSLSNVKDLMSSYQREELTEETKKEFQRGAGKPEGWKVFVRDEGILRREKSTLSNHAKKAHEVVLITVIENTYIGLTVSQVLHQDLIHNNLFKPISSSVRYILSTFYN